MTSSTPPAVILAGDVGATKTILAIFSAQDERFTPIALKNFPSQNYSNLEGLLADSGFAQANPVAVCFGVPGAVVEGSAYIVNLGWTIDAAVVGHSLGIPAPHLLNDLEAMAYGIAALEPKDFLVLNEGRARESATAALIAAGTGLGESLLYWDGRRHVPIPCEAGHGDFAPRNALEFQLLEYLKPKLGAISWERVLSGPGLVNIYSFLRDCGHAREQAQVAAQMREHDPAEVISTAGLERKCALCVKALDLFASLYGAESGNLALRAVAVGGVYVGGGIAPKIGAKLTDGTFMKSFVAKDRMADFLAEIPVRVILEERTALLGAASRARELAGDSVGAEVRRTS